ncbi:MAG: Ig-like domain-containing protein [Deltaproteobacteria bacterium]|nr:Ig-like domain-containing protein [Deltaproteobacteria bacterium]
MRSRIWYLPKRRGSASGDAIGVNLTRAHWPIAGGPIGPQCKIARGGVAKYFQLSRVAALSGRLRVERPSEPARTWLPPGSIGVRIPAKVQKTMLSILITLAGCSPEPASIKFDGEQTVTVNTLDAAAMNKATVLDKEGKALDPQPKLACSVNPASVAKLDGEKVAPVANGEATVECKVGEVKGSYKFVVALPDKVEVAGYDATQAWAVGASTQLTATVKAGDAPVAGQTVTWSSSDANIAEVDANGNVLGKAEGKATVTATSGTLTASVEVTIGGAMATTDAAAPAPQ